MYEYKIIRTERGWILSRKKELNGKGLWSPHKTFAKVYYDKDSAAEALVVIR